MRVARPETICRTVLPAEKIDEILPPCERKDRQIQSVLSQALHNRDIRVNFIGNTSDFDAEPIPAVV
jgi:hypothetical protein